MRTLTAALLAELGATITRPGYLVELVFSPTVRLSTLGDISWNGQTWNAADVQVRGLAESSPGAGGSHGATITWGNADLSAGALVLNQGIADRRVRVWAFYAGALATADAVQVFDGVGDDAEIDPEEGIVTIRLSRSATRVARLPLRYISPATGFNHLQPSGTRFTVGGQTYVLGRGA